MDTSAALLDIHDRTHRSLAALFDHLAGLPPEDLAREHAGFGYPNVRLQLHHMIGAEHYWLTLLAGRFVVMRTQTHHFTHLGQILAMLRLMGHPARGLDFPVD